MNTSSEEGECTEKFSSCSDSLTSVESSFEPDEKINKIIACKLCLEKYRDPIILPCFKTICSSHIPKDSKTYKCFFCLKSHLIPSNGFVKNKQMIQLLSFSDRYLNEEFLFYCEANKNSKAACKQLDDLIINCERLINYPNNHIEEEFNKIEKEIIVRKEELISMIEQNHKCITKALSAYKTMCKLEADHKMLELKKLIQPTKTRLKQWNENLKVIDCCFDEFSKSLIYNQKIETTKLDYLLARYKDNLLQFKDYKLITNEYNSSILGYLSIKNKEKIDEDRNEGTIHMVIENFGQFIDKYEYRESIDYVVIKNVAWRIQAEIERDENFELGLGFYVRADCDDEKLKKQPILAEINYQIIQTGESIPSFLDLKDTITQWFVKANVGHGFKSYISLRDIMEPSNGIYDKQGDFIILEVDVKVLERYFTQQLNSSEFKTAI